MKFYFSTKNNLLIITMLVIAIGASAQGTINSAYSRFGLGLVHPSGSFNHFAMGGVTTPISDPHIINYANPASYSYLDVTTLQIGGRGSLSRVSSSNAEKKIGGGQVSEIGFGFKRSGSRWGFACGVTPYSNIDYSFNSEASLNDTVKANYLYSGSGGLNRVIIGFSRSFRISSGKNDSGDKNDSKSDSSLTTVHQLSIGANFNYVFGNITRTNTVFYDIAQYFSTHEKINVWTQGRIYEAGLLYKVNLRTKLDDAKRVNSGMMLQVGADYMMNASMFSSYDKLVTIEDSISNIIYRDTSFQVKDERGRLKIPQKISLGVALKTFNKKMGTLTFGVDYKLQDWTKYELATPSNVYLDDGLARSTTISLGIEYKPSMDLSTDFFHRMNYRIGIRQTETSLVINGTQINQQAFSAGLSIPVIKSSSKIHLAAEFGQAGTTENGLLKEDFVAFMVGFTLTPSSFDRWFKQVKYD